MGRLERQASSGLATGTVPAQSYRHGLNDRALSGACVRLERRAVKVACVVLRGLGGCEPTWLPGAALPKGKLKDDLLYNNARLRAVQTEAEGIS
jgi:hypothetical protein